MLRKLKTRFPHTDRQGGMTVLMCIMLVAVLALGGLCIGIAQIQLARVETQIVADCASLSGAALFGEVHTGENNTPRRMAESIPLRNTILGRTANVSPRDVVIGRAVTDRSGRSVFQPNATPPNSVQVTMRLGGGGGMTAPKLLFPFLMESDSFTLSRSSVSAKLAHDVVLVIDRSGSMNWRLQDEYLPGGKGGKNAIPKKPHPTESRWGIMVNSMSPLFETFAESAVQERFTLVTFASNNFSFVQDGVTYSYPGASIDVESTTNGNDIIQKLRTMWDKKPLNGSTSIHLGIDMARNFLMSNEARAFTTKTIIVLTDGQQWPRSSREHYAAAKRAGDAGITLHSIGFSGGLFQPDVEEMARLGKGNAFLAPDAATLRQAFEDVAKSSPLSLIQ